LPDGGEYGHGLRKDMIAEDGEKFEKWRCFDDTKTDVEERMECRGM
jgi:hypothetical protein